MAFNKLLELAIEAYAELTGIDKKTILEQCKDFESVTSKNVLKLIVMSK